MRRIPIYKRRSVISLGVLALALVIGSASAVVSSRGNEQNSLRGVAPGFLERSLAVVDSTPEDKEVRIGIQVGHWKNSELPDELSNLRQESTGASVAGVNEWEVCLTVAEALAEVLGKEGVVVDVLPATVPPGYRADAFISLHADGLDDTSVSGFKVAPSAWDRSGLAARLSEAIVATYRESTGMKNDTLVTPSMRRYYAFNYGRFEHTIDPETPGVIVEMGFLTNAADRRLLVRTPERAVQGIAQGLLGYFKEELGLTRLDVVQGKTEERSEAY